ncbi:MAG: 1,4-alpha-glucan branching enzyme, partial [Actinotalea sp.]|nr:1,4-alpha-glucan branching enzyme [Actinotalea sp.]
MSTKPTSPAQPAPRHVAREELEAIVSGVHVDPHRVLGAHVDDGTVTVRALRPLADAVVVVTEDGEHAATHEHQGVWVVTFPGREVPDYRLRVTYGDHVTTADDPYRFLPTLGEVDLHLIAEGRHEELWTALGANPRTYPSALGDVSGTSFAVWAPNARAVRLVGDFNHWQGVAHALRTLGSSGVWEI